MLEYVEHKRAIAKSLADDPNPTSTEDLIAYILNGVDASYGPFTSVFRASTMESLMEELNEVSCLLVIQWIQLHHCEMPH